MQYRQRLERFTRVVDALLGVVRLAKGRGGGSVFASVGAPGELGA
jgi:hypothetical protein